MDYSNMSENDMKYIDSLFAKDKKELTNTELSDLIEYKAYQYATQNYFENIKEKEEENRKIEKAYSATLADEARKAFYAKLGIEEV